MLEFCSNGSFRFVGPVFVQQSHEGHVSRAGNMSFRAAALLPFETGSIARIHDLPILAIEIVAHLVLRPDFARCFRLRAVARCVLHDTLR